MAQSKPVGAFAPFWMDDVFVDPTACLEKLVKHRRFVAAAAAARAAFLEAKNNFEDNPGICSAGPEQAARAAFLTSLGLCVADYE